MQQTSREIVRRCLRFENPARIPRHLWVLPWAQKRYAKAIAEINEKFPGDFAACPRTCHPSKRIKGDPWQTGYFTDEWGCVFYNIQEGLSGEVRNPILNNLNDWTSIDPPYDMLPSTNSEIRQMYDSLSRFYDRCDQFVLPNCNPRPWERYQFLRGSENALIDVWEQSSAFKNLLKKIHEFYLKEVELWSKADVDAITFMDDWGTQNQLLIPPYLWREIFKPLYRDYCDIAKAQGKFVMMHSDGFIEDIFPDLIGIGVDGVNSQLFCMDFNNLSRMAKGKIAFWGEIDRQHILSAPDPEKSREAVRRIYQHFYDRRGGIIAQLEFGPGVCPENVYAVFDEWDKIQSDVQQIG